MNSTLFCLGPWLVHVLIEDTISVWKRFEMSVDVIKGFTNKDWLIDWLIAENAERQAKSVKGRKSTNPA